MKNSDTGTRTRERSRVALMAGGAVLALLASLGAASPAAAFGGASVRCYSNGIAYGDSSSTGAATSVTAGVVECGQARVAYRYWLNGQVVSTPYVNSWSVAYRAKPAGAIGVGGQHSVMSPGFGYGPFPFYT